METLKGQVEKAQIEVETKIKESGELLQAVQKETEAVDDERKSADAERLKCSQLEAETVEHRERMDEELKETMPAFERAMKAVQSVEKRALSEVKSFHRVHESVRRVFAAVHVLLAKDTSLSSLVRRDMKRADLTMSWDFLKKEIGKVDAFLTALVKFKQRIDEKDVLRVNVEACRLLLDTDDLSVEDLTKKSSAAAKVCEWLFNILTYYDKFCEIEPKRIAAAKAEEEMLAAQKTLLVIEERIVELTVKLEGLRNRSDEAEKEKEKAVSLSLSLTRKLELSAKLLLALEGERGRWHTKKKRLEEERCTLLGDSLLASSLVSFIGPFPHQYRDRLVSSVWRPLLASLGIPSYLSSSSEVCSSLVSSSEVVLWRSQGLPNDTICVQNATIMAYSSRYLLLVDPELQALSWLKHRFSLTSSSSPPSSSSAPSSPPSSSSIAPLSTSFVCVQASEGFDSYKESLKLSIQKGGVFLLENIGHSIDSQLWDVITHRLPCSSSSFSPSSSSSPLSSPLSQSTVSVSVDGQHLLVHPDFQLILQTRSSAPRLRAELQAETTVLNFRITPAGLEEQLLFHTVGLERPDLQEKRDELQREMWRMEELMLNLEDDLLVSLSQSKGSLLEDERMVIELNNTKETSVEVALKMKEATAAQEEMEKGRERYRNCAKRAALVFLSLQDLSHLHPMYRYSLEAFTPILEQAVKAVQTIDEHRMSDKDEEKVRSLAVKLLQKTDRGHGPHVLSPTAIGLQSVVRSAVSQGSTQRHTEDLTSRITLFAYKYAARGLFESHRQIFAAMLYVRILFQDGCITQEEMEAALTVHHTGSTSTGANPSSSSSTSTSNATSTSLGGGLSGVSPSSPTSGGGGSTLLDGGAERQEDYHSLHFLSHSARLNVLSLQNITAFSSIVPDLLSGSRRWTAVVESNEPEEERLPRTWATNTQQQQQNEKERRGGIGVASSSASPSLSSSSSPFSPSLSGPTPESAADAASQAALQVRRELFHKYLLIRAIRPDRTLMALEHAIKHDPVMGEDYIGNSTWSVSEVWKDLSPTRPLLFLLTPGMNPSDDVRAYVESERWRRERGCDNPTFTSLSLGSGQEGRASQLLHNCYKNGGVLFLHNAHFASEWLLSVESLLMGATSNPPHQDFRLCLAAESDEKGSNALSFPTFLRQTSVKVTTEPPSSVLLNMQGSLERLPSSWYDLSPSKPIEYKGFLFVLCFLHAVFNGRSQYGPQGWNHAYGFGSQDLESCLRVLGHYLENRDVLSWPEIRYILGDILYGGHITDMWDRRLLQTFFSKYVQPSMFVDIELTRGFKLPSFHTLDLRERDEKTALLEYVKENFTTSGPHVCGLTSASQNELLVLNGKRLVEGMGKTTPNGVGGLQYLSLSSSLSSSSSCDGEMRKSDESRSLSFSVEETKHGESWSVSQKQRKIHIASDVKHILDSLPLFDLSLSLSSSTSSSPSSSSSLSLDTSSLLLHRECSSMNHILSLCMSSIRRLCDALNHTDGSLSDDLDDLSRHLIQDHVPPSWISALKTAASGGERDEPSLFLSSSSLKMWLTYLVKRYQQLSEWSDSGVLPSVVWLSGLFHPRPFLASILQRVARVDRSPLDKLVLSLRISRKHDASDPTSSSSSSTSTSHLTTPPSLSSSSSSSSSSPSPKHGCYITGAVLKGTSWDLSRSLLVPPKHDNTLDCVLPLVIVEAVSSSSLSALRNQVNLYECPVYSTAKRADSYLFSTFLPSAVEIPSCIISSVCIVLSNI